MFTLGLASIFDYKTEKVYNWICLPLIICGIISFFLFPITTKEILFRIISSAVLFFVPLKFLGGGDKKLIIGIICFYGFKVGIFTFLCGNVLAAIFGLFSFKFLYKEYPTLVMSPFFLLGFIPNFIFMELPFFGIL